jgi:transcriptional regulator with XRE-family HTH domain
MNIGANIRSIRESKGIKQMKVADILEMDYSAYAKLEKRGNKITFEILEKIAKALSVSIIDLLDNEMNKPSSNQMPSTNQMIEELNSRIYELEKLNADALAFIVNWKNRVTNALGKGFNEDFFNTIINSKDTSYEEIESYPFFSIKIFDKPIEDIIEHLMQEMIDSKYIYTKVVDIIRDEDVIQKDYIIKLVYQRYLNDIIPPSSPIKRQIIEYNAATYKLPEYMESRNLVPIFTRVKLPDAVTCIINWDLVKKS